MRTCRLCGNSVEQFLQLGSMPLPEDLRTKEELALSVETYPLGLSACIFCHHVQLSSIIPQQKIYKEHYFYDYSLTKAGGYHFKKLAEKFSNPEKKKSFVVDIGSNTGLLLRHFANSGNQVLGVDPATVQAEIARASGVDTITEFFGEETAKRIAQNYGTADILFSTNTFDHIENLRSFMIGIVTLLSEEGTFIIEVPYFFRMVKELSHIVYHQQIDYVLLNPYVQFFRLFGLELYDAQEMRIHGGSVQMRVARAGKRRSTLRLAKLLRQEKGFFSDITKVLERFTSGVLKQKKEFAEGVRELRKHGFSIAGIGASAKGLTFLHYSGISAKDIVCISDASQLKTGKYTAYGIPIVSDKELLKKKPEYSIVLAWNFAPELMKKFGLLRRQGGKFIIPVPELRII